jgi:hypothetical protein
MGSAKRAVKKIALLVVLTAIVLFIVGGKAGRASSAATVQSKMPGPDAQQLWKYISKDNPYTSWKNFPDVPDRFLHVKENPHGDWIATYLNNEAYQSIVTPSKPFEMEYGSIVVKENYMLSNSNPPQQSSLTSVPVVLSTLTVMYKIRGYQQVPKQQEWFWVMYECKNGVCDGSVVTISNQPWLPEQIPLSKDTFAFYTGEVVAGKPWICVECHRRASQSDQFAYGDYLWRVKYFQLK